MSSIPALPTWRHPTAKRRSAEAPKRRSAERSDAGRAPSSAKRSRCIAGISTALAEYEEAMLTRSAQAAVETAETHALCFDDPNAPQWLLALLALLRGPEATA
jgi:hypothetical protein